jgi:hypothetical protein
MAQELLDYETPILGNYEKFLNYLEAIPSYQKIICILFFSLLTGFIIHHKASPTKDPIVSFLTVTGGLFILLMAIGFCLQVVLAISCAIIDAITNSTPKIERLGLLSVTLLLSLISLITIAILAIFIP